MGRGSQGRGDARGRVLRRVGAGPIRVVCVCGCPRVVAGVWAWVGARVSAWLQGTAAAWAGLGLAWLTGYWATPGTRRATGRGTPPTGIGRTDGHQRRSGFAGRSARVADSITIARQNRKSTRRAATSHVGRRPVVPVSAMTHARSRHRLCGTSDNWRTAMAFRGGEIPHPWMATHILRGIGLCSSYTSTFPVSTPDVRHVRERDPRLQMP